MTNSKVDIFGSFQVKGRSLFYRPVLMDHFVRICCKDVYDHEGHRFIVTTSTGIPFWLVPEIIYREGLGQYTLSKVEVDDESVFFPQWESINPNPSRKRKFPASFSCTPRLTILDVQND